MSLASVFQALFAARKACVGDHESPELAQRVVGLALLHPPRHVPAVMNANYLNPQVGVAAASTGLHALLASELEASRGHRLADRDQRILRGRLATRPPTRAHLGSHPPWRARGWGLPSFRALNLHTENQNDKVMTKRTDDGDGGDEEGRGKRRAKVRITP